MGRYLATMDDGATIALQVEDVQLVEPSSYCWEAGAWCYGTTDDVWFVSQDGRVDRWRDDPVEGLVEIEMGVGVVEPLREAADRWERCLLYS